MDKNGNHQEEDSSAEECQSDAINELRIIQRIRKINAPEDCRDKCIDNDECDFFRFQVQVVFVNNQNHSYLLQDHMNKKARKCFLLKLSYRPKHGWYSGEKYCSITNTTNATNNG